MTGSYRDFINQHINSETDVTNSLIHISYLYHQLQTKYQAVHGDPKIHNYTWLELDQPMDMIYDFRDGYDNNTSKVIRVYGVKHLFYITDFEFVYSPITKVVDGYSFNFKNDSIYGSEIENNPNIYYVPQITSTDPQYDYNVNLYGGYGVVPDVLPNSNPDPGSTLYNYYPIFPRMFTIDLITLIKMFLTYGYTDRMRPNLLRKLNMYFTRFGSYSRSEEDPNHRNKESYLNLGPAELAKLVSS